MPLPFTLTAQQRDAFDGVGVLRLPGFYPAEVVAPMADALWTDLERRYRLDRNRRETWTAERPSQFQAVERSGAFDGLASPALGALADAFLGAGAWDRPKRWGQPLVTFPSGAWTLPSKVWHLDYSTPPSGHRLGAIRCFVFLAPARPWGGTTIYVAGSHRVAMSLAAQDRKPVRSQDMRARLRAAHPWFALLWATAGDREAVLMEKGAEVRGVRVRVEEMTGDPGDLVIMHPNMLHGLTPNGLAQPRMALVQSLTRRDADFW